MKLRPFELIMIVVFGTLMFGALILLRTYKGEDGEAVAAMGVVSVWGVVPAETFTEILTDLGNANEAYKNVSYRYIPEEQFDEVFVNALADQKAPDLLFVPHDRLVKHRSRLEPIKYDSFPIRDFRTTYIDGAEIFALTDGIYALPVAVDPLVMYFNRDTFSANGFLVPPKTWEEVVGEIVPTLTERDYNRNIQKSGIAMGEYRNIKNAHGILSLLTLQGGSVMVTEDKIQYYVKIDQVNGQAQVYPFTNAATFYTNFSNTNNTLYSWNRSLPLDRDMFLSEDLALYFGYASEGVELALKNPNLSFDIAEVPQGEAATVKRTYGKYYGFMVPKAAKNKNGAFIVMQELSGQVNASKIASGYRFAPAHRSLLQVGSNDVYGRVSYASAIYARGWLSPDQKELDEALAKMVDDINANRGDVGTAAFDATKRIQQSY